MPRVSLPPAAALLSVLGLAGCAGGVSYASLDRARAWAAATNPYTACSDQARATAAVTAPKLAKAKTSDKSKVSDPEIRALLDLSAGTTACRNQYVMALSAENGPALPPLLDHWAEMDGNLAALIQKKQSWGQFKTKNSRIESDLETAIAAVKTLSDLPVEAQRQAELQSRLAFGLAMQHWADQRKLLDSLKRP